MKKKMGRRLGAHRFERKIDVMVMLHLNSIINNWIRSTILSEYNLSALDI